MKKDVLDPQGKVVGQTLKNIGIKNLNQVRQGKFFEIDMDEKDTSKAEFQVKEMCEKLLVNQTLKNMGYNNIVSVRQGKYFEIELEETDSENAKKTIEEICKKLLSNVTIEDFKINHK